MIVSNRKLQTKLKEKIKDAEERGIECNLTEDDMIALYKRNPGYCEYTGVHFNGEPENRPSIERIDSSKGYVRGNICLISVTANGLKNSLIDQKECVKFTINKNKKALVQRMMKALTPEYLDKLKDKYNADLPEVNDPKETIDYLKSIKIFESNQPIYTNDITVFKTKEGTKILTPETQTIELRVASYFVAMSKLAIEYDMKFDLTFAEMKTVFSRKRCAFSKETVSLDEKFVLIKDKSLPLNKDNITMVHEKYAFHLNKLSDKTGLSINKIAKNFKSFK